MPCATALGPRRAVPNLRLRPGSRRPRRRLESSATSYVCSVRCADRGIAAGVGAYPLPSHRSASVAASDRAPPRHSEVCMMSNFDPPGACRHRRCPPACPASADARHQLARRCRRAGERRRALRRPGRERRCGALGYTRVRPWFPPSVQATLQIFASQAIDGAATGVTAKPPAVTVTGGSMLPSTTSVGATYTVARFPLTGHAPTITFRWPPLGSLEIRDRDSRAPYPRRQPLPRTATSGRRPKPTSRSAPGQPTRTRCSPPGAQSQLVGHGDRLTDVGWIGRRVSDHLRPALDPLTRQWQHGRRPKRTMGGTPAS